MTDDRERADAGTIDATFEPAPERIADESTGTGKPGWVALGIASILAAGTGALVGSTVNVTPTGGSSSAITEVVGDLDAVVETQRLMEATLADLRKDLDATSGQLDRAIEGVSAGGSGRSLSALSTEIGALDLRLSELEANGTDGPATPSISGEALSALRARVDRIERSDAAEESGSPRLLNRAVTELRDRLDAVEATQLELTRAAGVTNSGERASALADEVDALRAEIEALKAGNRLAPGTTPAPASGARADVAEAALALSTIEAASRRGRPFAAAQARLAAALPGDPAVLALAEIAETGAPTLSELRTRFSAAEAAAIKSGTTQTRDDGWDWLRRAGDNMVTVRRTDAQPGEGTISTLTAAGRMLNNGDLAGAVAAVEMLGGEAEVAMADWLGSAQDRIRLDAALDSLRLRMIELQP